MKADDAVTGVIDWRNPSNLNCPPLATSSWTMFFVEICFFRVFVGFLDLLLEHDVSIPKCLKMNLGGFLSVTGKNFYLFFVCEISVREKRLQGSTGSDTGETLENEVVRYVQQVERQASWPVLGCVVPRLRSGPCPGGRGTAASC